MGDGRCGGSREHLADYRAALETLSAQGLVYPSFESRAEIARLVGQREANGPWPRDPDGAPLYPGAAKSLSPAMTRARWLQSGAPYALRLDMAAACARGGIWPGPSTVKVLMARPVRSPPEPQAWGDVILARKETPTSYHLSVVIDDALQGVTDVVRGQDLFWSTSVHRLLQRCSACRSRPTGTIGWCSTTPGKSSRNRPAQPACGSCAPAGRRAADIRRLVGLASDHQACRW